MYNIKIEICEGKGGVLGKDELGIIYPDVVKVTRTKLSDSP